MFSLMSLAAKGDWDKCNAMLNQGKGNVKECDEVRAALSVRS
jgi:hypothetical protein